MIVNDGISGPQQTWLVAICNLAVVLILVLLSGLALRRGTSERPAVVDVKRPLLHSQKPEGTLLLYWFHFRHGVHWRTAEPRDRYLQLIGEETGT
ncbi:MAG: hypothetical protein P8X95_09755 [Anaerolineales bacterium]